MAPGANDERFRGPDGILLGPHDYPLSTPVSHLAPKGCLDGFLAPSRFFGWVGFPNASADLETRVVIKIGHEIVGAGKPTRDRPDVMNVAQPAGFVIETTRPLSHEEVASGGLAVEATAGPHRGPLRIPSHIARRSFDFVALSYLSRASGWDRDDVAALAGFAEAEGFSPVAKRKLLAMLAVLNKGSRSRRLEELAVSAAEGLKDGMVIGAQASPKSLSDGEVAAHFESLGQTSEFGFIQRHFDRDPASLLRWATVPYDMLIRGLQNRFAGVGDPTYTVLAPHYGDGEYATRDTRYNLASHTFTRTIPKERFDAEFAAHCRRLVSLRSAFIESLADSAQIFLRFDHEALSLAQIHALFGELNKYGRNRLLIVRADRGKDGAVETLRPDLCLGYVRSFSQAGAIDRYEAPESWIAMLRNALSAFGA